MAFEMQDRLLALRNWTAQSLYDGDVVQDEAAIEGEEEMEDLFHTVEEIGHAINQINTNVERIKYNHGVILAEVKNQVVVDKNGELVEELKELSHAVLAALKRLRQDIEDEEQAPLRNTADFRIRKAQYATLSWTFLEVMGEYYSELDEYRHKNKDRIKRQLRLTGLTVTDDQVEEWLATGHPNLFKQDILIDTAQKREALSEVEGGHPAIMKLEHEMEDLATLHELYAIFLDVGRQGELSDTIEHNLEYAAIHVDQDHSLSLMQSRNARGDVESELSKFPMSVDEMTRDINDLLQQAELLHFTSLDSFPTEASQRVSNEELIETAHTSVFSQVIKWLKCCLFSGCCRVVLQVLQ